MSANIVQQFGPWLRQQWPLVILVLLTVFLAFGARWLEKPVPTIIRSVGSSTQHVDVLWFRQEFLNLARLSTGEVAYALSSDRNILLAIDSESGSTLWQVTLPSDQSGARGLLVEHNMAFVVNTLSVNAYGGGDGTLKWSTPLGQGHVTVMEQLDGGAIRIYYGDTIYELGSNSGKMLNVLPRASTTWIRGNIVLKETGAFDKLTGKALWEPAPLLFLSESVQPIDYGSDMLLVAQGSGANLVRGICALDLRTGQYVWCRPEEFNSVGAIDSSSQRAFAMRSDNVLLTLDLQTGSILGTISFLASEPIPSDMGTSASIAVSHGIVVISFSDSKQTFGLRITP